MYKIDIVKRIVDTGVMAIVRTESKERGIEIAEGCLAGHIDVLEISYTLPNAGEVISSLHEYFGDDLLIGAGTILDDVTARLAILAGANFIIAPTFSRDVAIMCNRYQIPYAPGCTTISEMVEALEVGASLIKAFPISNFYGPKLVEVIKTPIPTMPILASGGVTLANLSSWFHSGVDCVGIGGLLTKGSKEQIAKQASRIRQIIDQERTTIKI